MSDLNGECVICDASISATPDTQVSEILSCSDCGSSLVVSQVNGNVLSLEEAPEVEEDWGE